MDITKILYDEPMTSQEIRFLFEKFVNSEKQEILLGFSLSTDRDLIEKLANEVCNNNYDIMYEVGELAITLKLRKRITLTLG